MIADYTITISGFSAGCAPVWQLRPGVLSVIYSSRERARRSLLYFLAGQKEISGLKIEIRSKGRHDTLRALPSTAVLPPAGEEVFVGTTVGEQLRFYSRDGVSCQALLDVLDKRFGFGFHSMGERSVWELGAGEQRCLLLVSQALAGPRSWIMHGPLERLDGPRRRSMLKFIDECTAQGKPVVAGTGQPACLSRAKSCLLVPGETGRELMHQAEGESAVELLAGEPGPSGDGES